MREKIERNNIVIGQTKGTRRPKGMEPAASETKRPMSDEAKAPAETSVSGAGRAARRTDEDERAARYANRAKLGGDRRSFESESGDDFERRPVRSREERALRRAGGHGEGRNGTEVRTGRENAFGNRSGRGGRHEERKDIAAEESVFELGKRQELKVVKQVEFGYYLGTENERVLLPVKQAPEGLAVGDSIEVFLYKDSSDRLIATTGMPKLSLGEFALLDVLDVTKIGAFLDWGLEKDLMLPYKEQTKKVEKGEQVLAGLYVDKSGRLCGTMKVYSYLRKDSPYKKGDQVTGRVYEISGNFGAFVAVDDRYSALIPKKHLYGDEVKVGDVITAIISQVHEDGKIDLQIRQRAHIQMKDDAEKVLELLDSFSGVLPFTDKASPEVIRRETGMSKNEFKRAVGHLYKERKILITETAIRKA